MPACVKAKKYPGWKEEASSEDPNDQEIAFMPGHKLVHITGHKRACAYCNILRLKTKSGWAIKSYYKCEACDVCLCKGKKDCFLRYHELRMEQPDLSPKMLLKTLKEATASQTPKKPRKTVKAEEGYSPKQSFTNVAPKYEEFTNMLSQSITDQLAAYVGILDPDDKELTPNRVAHNPMPSDYVTENVTSPSPNSPQEETEKQTFITVDPKAVLPENGFERTDSADSNMDVQDYDDTNSDTTTGKGILPIKDGKSSEDLETTESTFSPNQQEYLL